MKTTKKNYIEFLNQTGTQREIKKIQLNSWAGSKNYFSAEKYYTETSYGKKFTRYKVLNRNTFLSDGEIITDENLKGLEFSSNEVKEI